MKTKEGNRSGRKVSRVYVYVGMRYIGADWSIISLRCTYTRHYYNTCSCTLLFFLSSPGTARSRQNDKARHSSLVFYGRRLLIVESMESRRRVEARSLFSPSRPSLATRRRLHVQMALWTQLQRRRQGARGCIAAAYTPHIPPYRRVSTSSYGRGRISMYAHTTLFVRLFSFSATRGRIALEWGQASALKGSASSGLPPDQEKKESSASTHCSAPRPTGISPVSLYSLALLSRRICRRERKEVRKDSTAPRRSEQHCRSHCTWERKRDLHKDLKGR